MNISSDNLSSVSGLTFRDGSHSQSHSNFEIVDGTAEPGSPVDGVIEMANVDDPHSHTDEGDDLDEKQPRRRAAYYSLLPFICQFSTLRKQYWIFIIP